MSKFNVLRIGVIPAAFIALALPTGVLAQPARASAVPAAPAAPSGQEAGPSEYILGPEDVIEYDVVGTSDKTRARIYTDGTIQTNLGGRIVAAGKTPRELGAEIAKVLKTAGFYADPVVNIEVVGFASRYVTVLGAVGSPGLVPINRAYRLSEILARVGGVRPEAADFIVVRSENGAEKRYSVAALASGNADQDPAIAPGDKIYSPEAELFYVAGQVNTPGAYPLKSGMTVAQAVAKGGGVSENGSSGKVSVRRAGKKIKLKQEELVMPGDVITVSERLF